jgi:isochorismate pyruvate lyase
MTPKPPADCSSLDEIRAGMDAIDRQIIALIAKRVEYVREAAKFKTSVENVAAPERVEAVLKTRRAWAEAAGLDGEAIERLYRDLVAYSVSEEHKRWREMNAGQ